MKLLGVVLTKRPVIAALIFMLVMIAMIAGALKMKLATGNETLMSSGSKVYQDNLELEKYFGGESIVLFSTSQQDYGMLTVNNLQRMNDLQHVLKQYDDVYSFVSPASIVDQLTAKQFEKMSGSLMDIQNGLNGKLRPIFGDLILDPQHSVIMIKLKGDTDDLQKGKIIDAIKEQLKRSPFDGTDTIVTGKPVMDQAVHASMKESMKKMIGIAVVLMLIVLTIVFRVRWRVLAIPVILMSVLATLGLMGHVGVPMTMVSMAVFPILIGLGVDYAIQFQNRYEEERKEEETANA